MITKQEVGILVQQLSKAPMDQAQLYAVNTILKKIEAAAQGQEEKEAELPSPQQA